ncbi:MAG: zinc-binding alcohol dehydrogenase family protein [Tannerellaceae bacterium]|jgi:2-desacetyl-2-hydroxyethyl bacteriochlorophyllide A dehydrogenase|nr:zinc-binding alcohol dehydrogenase family protein [Tannerellaceae bacterium]
MKAIQIIQQGEVRVVDIEKPQWKADEVLLKLNYAGFCGSDLNTFLGKNPMVIYPVIPGHEISAQIVETGRDVPLSYTPGAKCTLHPYTHCGQCSSCRNGRPNACKSNRTMGVQRDGAMCEYVAVPWQKVIPVEGIPDKDLALIEPLSVGFHAVARAGVTDSDVVMAIGCGMVGMGAIIRASIRGANVIAVDIDDTKLSLAKRCGAHYTIHSKTEDVHEALQKITGGNGPDVVIEAVGSPETYQSAIREVAFSGRVVYIGYAKNEVAFETRYFVMKELDIKGSRNATPEDFRAVISYLKRGVCPTQEFISNIYPPEEARKALTDWQSNPGKIFRILIAF